MARKHTVRLIVLALLLAACDGAGPSSSVEPVRVVSDPHTVCPNGEELALRVDARGEQVLRGDIDGDGAEDEVWLASDPSVADPCSDFLAVETADRIYWAVTNRSDTPSSLETPTLNSLSEIDEEVGKEIVVNLEAGASTQFVGVFKLTRAGLERMVGDGEGLGPFGTEIEGLFAYGGSVGHLEAVDCTQDGLVVMSVGLPVGAAADAYKIERRFFTSSYTAFVLEEELTEKHIVQGLKVDDFPEFAASPFGSCD